MRVYAYVRVSTDQQAESGAGLAGQEDSCRRWAERHGVTIERVFTEEGISGKTSLEKRPALLSTISSLNKGDVLIVAKRDRLGRDPIAVAMIEASVERKKAKIISAAGEGTDNAEPTSILMRRMVDAFAEYERLVIGARTKAALQAKISRGERAGHIPFRFQLAADRTRIEQNRTEQAIIAQIGKLRSQALVCARSQQS